jgi:hypothetical protein
MTTLSYWYDRMGAIPLYGLLRGQVVGTRRVGRFCDGATRKGRSCLQYISWHTYCTIYPRDIAEKLWGSPFFDVGRKQRAGKGSLEEPRGEFGEALCFVKSTLGNTVLISLVDYLRLFFWRKP